MPNGTATNSGITAFANSDINNASFGDFSNSSAYTRIRSSKTGTGAFTPIAFFTSDIERMRIDLAGNLCLGVTPSLWHATTRAIDIGTVADSGTLYSSIGLNSSHVALGANHYYDSSFIPRYKGNYAATVYQQSNGTHEWKTAPSGTAGSAITWTNAMSLDASNLIVGTGVVGHSIKSQYDASNYTAINSYTVADTTHIYKSIIGGVLKSAILANGTFQSATNVYGSTSDIKLKENVVDTSPKLDKLMQVQVRNFNYIGQEDSKQIGVVAQEIEQIFPSLVFETKDTKQVEVEKERLIPAVDEIKDDEGNVVQEAVAESIETYTETETVETGEVTKNVKYSVIYMMMLKGMQEQQEIINDLKSRIEILEGAK